MLQSAVFDQCALGNVVVILRQTHHKTKICLRVWVEFACAEFEDVTETFGWAMFAVDAIVGSWVANVRQSKVDLVVDFLHGR
jgi:hypothetical protein